MDGSVEQALGALNWDVDFAEPLRQALAPYVEMLEQFQARSGESFERFQRFIDNTQSALQTLDQYFQDLYALDWDAASRSCRASFLAIAEAGWTTPNWLSITDSLDLSKQTPIEIDAIMTAGFMDDGAENLELLRDKLLSSPALTQWHRLLGEIVDSIKAGFHRVAIPAALTVLEGLISQSLVACAVTVPRNTSPTRKLTMRDDVYEAFFWESVMPFIDKVFAYSNFGEAEPTFINRNWVLHGRSANDWTIADALRLTNAIATLDYLFEKIGWPK